MNLPNAHEPCRPSWWQMVPPAWDSIGHLPIEYLHLVSEGSVARLSSELVQYAASDLGGTASDQYVCSERKTTLRDLIKLPKHTW